MLVEEVLELVRMEQLLEQAELVGEEMVQKVVL